VRPKLAWLPGSGQGKDNWAIDQLLFSRVTQSPCSFLYVS
jgi:hypothetical protein